ncbi:MAG: TolC family protein [Deltaproteobacteria bacterium]|nr:MAG: TolC family protein [Deltaproteobacteria bacterium]
MGAMHETRNLHGYEHTNSQTPNLFGRHHIIKGFGILLVCLAFNLLPQTTGAQKIPPLLSLKTSIEIALERNFSIRVALEEIEVARQQRKEAVTGFLPQLSAEYEYRRVSENATTVEGVTIPFADRNQYKFTGTLEQPLFTGFSTLTSYQLAKLGLDVAEIQLAQARLDLILQVKEAYFGILRAERLRKVAEDSVRQLREGVRVSAGFYQEGMRAKVDVLDAETRLARAEEQLIRATNDLNVAIARFNTLLRLPTQTQVKVEDILTVKHYERSYESSREIALKNRPELLEAERNVTISNKEVTLVKSEYYPDIALSLNYKRRGDDLTVDGSEFVDRETWDLVATATWTFFEWGKTRYAANQQRARSRQAIDVLEELKNKVSLQVRTAYLTLEAADKAIVAAKKGIISAEENFRMSAERYKEEVATATEVLDAQTRLTEARANYTNALAAFNVARARLIRAMGLEEEL